MSLRICAVALACSAVFFSCTKDVKCIDTVISPAFIGFPLADIDTFIIRKFEPGTNFQKQIDTSLVQHYDYYQLAVTYQISHDTTFVNVQDNGIKAGFDWEIFIPSLNRTTRLSGIVSEKRTIQCGLRSVQSNCGCSNGLFSAQQDNATITFPDVNFKLASVYITR